MKLRQLEIALQDIQTFQNPKIHLEQYVTTPHLAACLLHTAESQFGDVVGKAVCDLGCGCGILSIGSSILGASYCLGVDIDKEALGIFLSNCEDYELESTVDCVHSDVVKLASCRNVLRKKQFDTVIMNPPFGTKSNKGIDMDFLKAASQLAREAVFSLHKSSTRGHVVKKAHDMGMNANVIAEMRYNLDASYKFHKKKSKDIEVDFIRFTFNTK
uniref:Uncharacterized protein n=1 Tax=Ciona savignyi TaxID=51511 RepID=H2ZQD2_CIOSA